MLSIPHIDLLDMGCSSRQIMDERWIKVFDLSKRYENRWTVLRRWRQVTGLASTRSYSATGQAIWLNADVTSVL